MPGSLEVLTPHPALRPFVDHYWRGLDNGEPTFPVMPDGAVDVVICRSGGDARAWVYGTSTRRADVVLATGAHYFGIRFRPAAARHFLTACARELTDGAETAAGLLRPSLDGLPERLCEPDVGCALDARLIGFLSRAVTVRTAVDDAVDCILDARGGTTIDEVADRVARSRRHLERAFLDHVGVTPKFFARIVRFRRAVRLVGEGRQSLADVAAVAGYADQSHMNRDFRALGGISPGRFCARDVAFLQDPQAPRQQTGDSCNFTGVPP